MKFKINDFEEESRDLKLIIDKTQQEIDYLIKKYQKRPETLIEDYDEVIKMGLIGIIANSRANATIRTDIITNIDSLIRIREFVINQYSNNGSDYNK